MPNVLTGRTLGEGIRTEAQFALEELDVVQECLVLSLLLDQLLDGRCVLREAGGETCIVGNGGKKN